MTDLRAIDTLTLTDVRQAVRQALRPAVDADSLDDFVSSVDWSGLSRADQSVVDMLSLLESLTTDYLEGVMPLRDFVAGLLSAMPEPERRDLVPTNGRIVITPDLVRLVVTPEAAPPPLRTGPAALAPA